MAKARNGTMVDIRISASPSARMSPSANDSAVYTMVLRAAMVMTSGNISPITSVLRKLRAIVSQSANSAIVSATSAARPYITLT